MAYILKAGKTFTNPYDASLLATAYGIVDNVRIYKGRRQADFMLSIYASRTARASGLQALVTYLFDVTDPQFTTYFAPTLTTTIWAQTQAYLVGEGFAGVLVTADWKIDPQSEP